MPDAPEWSIEFFIDDRGSSPVEEFLKELQPKERAAMLRTIQLLRSYGVQLPMPYARQVVGPIWELRAGAGRVFYFVFHGQRCILLHAYRKKTQQTPTQEIDTARRRRETWLRREYDA